MTAFLQTPAIVVLHAEAPAFNDAHREALVDAMMRETGLPADQVQFRLGYRYGDGAEPGWTWVNLVLDETGRQLLNAVVAAVIAWGLDWFAEARKRDPRTVPVQAIIYGPDGEVLRRVEVDPDRRESE